jgi:hypothetical protein
MTDHDDTPDNASGGGTSLKGYLYQLDISIWAALDLLLAKKLAQQLVLEPASKEDLGPRERARLTAVAGTYVTIAMILAMSEESVPPGTELPFKPDDP